MLGANVNTLTPESESRGPHLFWQAVWEHMRGSVNLNCCSTLRTSVPHSRQRKHPINSSGRTSLVRVTVPMW